MLLMHKNNPSSSFVDVDVLIFSVTILDSTMPVKTVSFFLDIYFQWFKVNLKKKTIKKQFFNRHYLIPINQKL